MHADKETYGVETENLLLTFIKRRVKSVNRMIALKAGETFLSKARELWLSTSESEWLQEKESNSQKAKNKMVMQYSNTYVSN